MLSRKQPDDGFLNCECASYNRPQLYRGVWIAARICIDAFDLSEPAHKQCQREVLSFLAPCSPKVLCIPVTTKDYDTAQAAKKWAVHVPTVIANSDNYQPSVV